MQAATETLREKLTRVNAELTAAGRYDNFYASLEAAWNRYGSLTERQEAALVRSFAQRDEREARRAQENAAVTQPMPTGRVVICGEVISTKYQESRFGTQFKMLLKSDFGWKVYGTVPASIACCGETLKGRRVTFTAAIEPKEAAFGFFSRPTNASVLERQAVGQQPEATAPVAPAPAAAPAAGGLVAGNDFERLLVRPPANAAPTECTNKPVFAAKPSLADIIARAKALEAARAEQTQYIIEESKKNDSWDNHCQ